MKNEKGKGTMARYMIFLTFLLGYLFPFVQLNSAKAYNPQPAEGDFVLPMPHGEQMAFRPVYIGEGGTPFSLRKFNVGDPDAGFKEHPTSVVLGGAFLGHDRGGKDWLYYLGKYEVTEAQYHDVLDLHENNSHKLVKSNYPISKISWFEAMAFVDAYNQWLLKNALNNLPKNERSVGFTRLPTEIEWEFAARGGTAVSSEEFDRKQPYHGNLASFEWFSGPKSSHNKVKKAGLLKPNPLGLYDMLGNVSEMTMSLYQIEYYQGRYGGFVARGGHFFTSENRIRSSLRTEEPFYIKSASMGFKPNEKPTMGFRLVLSYPIFADRDTERQLATAWEKYRGGKGRSFPAAASVSPTSKQTSLKSEDVYIHLKRLKTEIGKIAGLPSSIRHELGLVEASMGDIVFIRKQAEEDSAFAWTKIAAERGFFIFKELRKLPIMKKLLSIANRTGRTGMIEKYKEREAELAQNIDQALGTYGDSFKQLSKVAPAAIKKGFEKYAKFLLKHNAAEQIRVLKIVMKHFASFQNEKRVKIERWRLDFSK